MDDVPHEIIDSLVEAMARSQDRLRDAIVDRVCADVAPQRLGSARDDLSPALDRLLPAIFVSLRTGESFDAEETLLLRQLGERWARRGMTLATLCAAALAAAEGARGMTNALADGGGTAPVMLSFAQGMRVAQEATAALVLGHARGAAARQLGRWFRTGVDDDAPPAPAPAPDASSATAPSSLRPPAHDVLALVAKGCTNAQIGEVLHLSRQAVNYHVGRLMRSVGAANRAALVARAYQVGLLRVED